MTACLSKWTANVSSDNGVWIADYIALSSSFEDSIRLLSLGWLERGVIFHLCVSEWARAGASLHLCLWVFFVRLQGKGG